MAVRIITGLILTAVFLGIVLYAPIWGIQAFLGFAAVLTTWEFIGLGGEGIKKTDQWVGSIAVALLLIISAIWNRAILPGMVGVSLLLLLYVLFTHAPMPTAGKRANALLASVMYIGMMFLSLFMLAEKNRYLILVAAAIAFVGDTTAYFGGKTMGRHKLWPAVSPKKTWEGSFWGVVGSVLGVFAIKALFPAEFGESWVPLVILGVIGGTIGQMGDWVESVFKRSIGAKDSGKLLPGHGGVYDRVDAFMFAGVVTWLWMFFGWL